MSQSLKNQEKSNTTKTNGGFFYATSRAYHKHRLGDVLVKTGAITREALERALAEQKGTKEQLGKILIRQGALSAQELRRKLARQWCLKISAGVFAFVMQVTTPTLVMAGEIAPAAGVTATFSVASSAASAMPRMATHGSGLFGSEEVRSRNVSAFKKWTGVMARYEAQTKALKVSAPRVVMWQNELKHLSKKPQREQIEAVNDYFNAVRYIEDKDNYGREDYWATPIEFLSRGGDCEDFAIAKYASLRALGFSNDQLRIAIVQDQVKNIPHAILIVYSNDGPVVLDNQNKQTMSVAKVDRYRPIFSINAENWWLHRAPKVS